MVLRYAHPTEEHQSAAVRRVEEFNRTSPIAEDAKRDEQLLHIPLQ